MIPLKKRKAKTRHLYSKLIIIYCIFFSSLTSLWSLWLAERGIIVTELLITILALFGGELLLICLRQVLEKNNKGE